MTNLGLTTGINQNHMTDEAHQLFLGLEAAGYKLVGHQMTDQEIHVPSLLTKYRPDVVLVQDQREWDGLTAGRSPMPEMRFTGVEAIRDSGAFVGTVLKDAQNNPDYHRSSAERMGAHFWVIYYHPRIVAHLAPYVRSEHLVRTWHSIDPAVVPEFRRGERRSCLVSGALSRVYPLRTRLAREAARIGADVLQHPGYHRRGCETPKYIETLAGYKVAVCTSSIYGYALRKIVEATAAGCAVITDLPVDEVMPEIDGNLHRVEPDLSTGVVARIVADLDRKWDPVVQRRFSDAALAWYNWRSVGERLAADIESMRRRYNARSNGLQLGEGATGASIPTDDRAV